MKEIKFSVIVPVYNAEKYLTECVDSILKQTKKPYEIILIDDGSKDGSANICDEYVQKFPSVVKCLHKENQGALSARISGVSLATGDFFVFVDADDYLDCCALEVIKDTIIKHNADGVVFDFRKVDNFGVKITEDKIPEEEIVIESVREKYRFLFLGQNNAMWRKAFRADIFQNKECLEFSNIKYAEDLLQSVSLVKRCKKLVVIPDILYNYRTNPSGAIQTKNLLSYKDDLVVYKYIYHFLREEKVFTKQDYDNYRESRVVSMVSELLRIAGFKEKLNNKIKVYRDITNSFFYKEFLVLQDEEKLKTKKDRLVFGLFKKKRYKTLIFLLQTYRLIKRTK